MRHLNYFDFQFMKFLYSYGSDLSEGNIVFLREEVLHYKRKNTCSSNTSHGLTHHWKNCEQENKPGSSPA
jgi:hypothetical protein